MCVCVLLGRTLGRFGLAEAARHCVVFGFRQLDTQQGDEVIASQIQHCCLPAVKLEHAKPWTGQRRAHIVTRCRV